MIQKTKLFHILLGAGLIALALIGFLVFRPHAAGRDTLGKIIETKSGNISLQYKNGTVSIGGDLSRSTPCVDWQVKSSVENNVATFDIIDANKGTVCVQALGVPQSISATAGGFNSVTRYVVTLEGETVFSGNLEPSQIPAAPTSGTVAS